MRKVHKLTILYILLIVLYTVENVQAQEKEEKNSFLSSIKVSGDVQSDILLAENDTAIKATNGDKPFKSISHLRLMVQNDFLEAGLRASYMKTPLPGYEADFAGAGISNMYIRGRYKKLDITVGDFYEQFGNGLIFRTYEERNLGIDNSLRGVRLLTQPIDGLYIKLLGGSQKYYFKERNNTVYGGDVELNLDKWIKVLSDNDWRIRLGNSSVSKTEPDELIMVDAENRLNLPKYVFANSSRLAVTKGNFSLLSEYAIKWNDPSFDNGYLYKKGSAFLLSTSYTQKGFSLLLQAKRNENMSFRSVRSRVGISSFINHLPPFSMQHTYTLAAHYPYATQPLGEWAFQGESRYLIKKNTALGGKYGTKLRLNLSYIRSTHNKSFEAQNKKGSLGYVPSFFEMGDEVYYSDVNFEISKKISSKFSFTAIYMNQIYNQKVIEGHGNNGDIVYSNIFVFDGKYKVKPKFTLRSELQYLQTKQDEGDWMYAMLECSLFYKMMISVSDTYNIGTTKLHYPMLALSYNYKSMRMQLGYGRTREGINCAGGVCRTVPASRGLSFSLNYMF